MKRMGLYFVRLAAVALVALALSVSALAADRILVVGDSWSAGMTVAPYGHLLQTLLKENGINDCGVVYEKTAKGGSRADQWAQNKKGMMDELKSELRAHPTVDVVLMVIGGNDVLNAAIKDQLAAQTAKEREAFTKVIIGNIQTMIKEIRSVSPKAHIILSDYDYLNIDRIRATFGWSLDGLTQQKLNDAFLAVGQAKRALMKNTGNASYVQNWGVLQHHFGDPDAPLPGGPPKYAPYPGGKPALASPESAFVNNGGAVNDGVHPSPEGYRRILQNIIDQALRPALTRKAK